MLWLNESDPSFHPIPQLGSCRE